MKKEVDWRMPFFEGREDAKQLLKSDNLPFYYSKNSMISPEYLAIEFIGAATSVAENYANKDAHKRLTSQIIFSLGDTVKEIEMFEMLGKSYELLNNPKSFLEKNIAMQSDMIHPKDAVSEFLNHTPHEIEAYIWNDRRDMNNFITEMRSDYQKNYFNGNIIFFKNRLEKVTKAISAFKDVFPNANVNYASEFIGKITAPVKIYSASEK